MTLEDPLQNSDFLKELKALVKREVQEACKEKEEIMWKNGQEMMTKLQTDSKANEEMLHQKLNALQGELSTVVNDQQDLQGVLSNLSIRIGQLIDKGGRKKAESVKSTSTDQDNSPMHPNPYDTWSYPNSYFTQPNPQLAPSRTFYEEGKNKNRVMDPQGYFDYSGYNKVPPQNLYLQHFNTHSKPPSNREAHSNGSPEMHASGPSPPLDGTVPTKTSPGSNPSDIAKPPSLPPARPPPGLSLDAEEKASVASKTPSQGNFILNLDTTVAPPDPTQLAMETKNWEDWVTGPNKDGRSSWSTMTPENASLWTHGETDAEWTGSNLTFAGTSPALIAPPRQMEDGDLSTARSHPGSDQGKAEKNFGNTNVQWTPMNITLIKSAEASSLGTDVNAHEDGTLSVETILPGGMVMKFNETQQRNGGEMISVGDRICVVNGIKEPKAILAECKKSVKLNLVVLHKKTVPTGILRGDAVPFEPRG